MEQIELTSASVEAIAQRVAELLALDQTPVSVATETVPLLPIAPPRPPEPSGCGRGREDLAGALHGMPFRRRSQ